MRNWITSEKLVQQNQRNYGRFERTPIANPLDEFSGIKRLFNNIRLKEWVGFALFHPDIYGAMIIQNAKIIKSSDIHIFENSNYTNFQSISISSKLKISEDLLHEKLSFASPYLQLIEELTLSELVEHCKVSKPFKQNLSTQSFIEAIDLKTSSDKLIKQFSSGMKQRVKLGLALYADTPLLLLDEPISNLDERSIDWYQNQLAMLSNNRTIIVCSNNIKQEFFCCDKSLNLMAFKN